MSTSLTTWVVLLRGVTPSGRNRVPMAELRAGLTAAGLADVRTYIQSGNVIARSPLGREALKSLVHDVIATRIGADITVIARTAAELQRIVERNPFPESDKAQTYFSLLAATPAPDALKALRAGDFAPDEVRVGDGAIYVRYATRLSDSRVNNNFLERRLKVAATTRNFNTMTKLVELSGPGERGG
jgi:uncharacterized protein (DUF1697 family)